MVGLEKASFQIPASKVILKYKTEFLNSLYFILLMFWQLLKLKRTRNEYYKTAPVLFVIKKKSRYVCMSCSMNKKLSIIIISIQLLVSIIAEMKRIV